MSPTTTKQRRRRLQISRGPGRAKPSPGGSSRGSPGSGGDAPGPPSSQLSAHPGRRSHLPNPQMAPQRRRPGKVSQPQNHRAPSPSVWGRGISGETAVPCREPPPPRLLQKTRPPAWRTPASPAWASRGVFVPTGAGCDFLSPSSHPRLIFLPHTLSERIGPKKINKGEKKIATLY